MMSVVDAALNATAAAAGAAAAAALASSPSASVLDECGEAFCGWVAALVGAACYGSFGVPVKRIRVDVHPLVLQSFKTLTFALTGWLVVPLFGVQPAWTWWGLLSGMLWVVGGTGGIYAIRAAGIAVAVGTWASVMVMVNFCWGILVFREPVSSVPSTLGAFLCLATGIVGMSMYSTSATATAAHHDHPRRPKKEKVLPSPSPTNNDDTSIDNDTDIGTVLEESLSLSDREMVPLVESEVRRRGDLAAAVGGGDDDDRSETLTTATTITEMSTAAAGAMDAKGNDRAKDALHSPLPARKIPGLSLRASGIAAAVFNGLVAGSSLIPIHYAKRHGFGGANYIISFSSGSLVANLFVWLVVFLHYCRVERQQQQLHHHSVTGKPAGTNRCTTAAISVVLANACERMPPWHLRKIFVPGIIAGKIRTELGFSTTVRL